MNKDCPPYHSDAQIEKLHYTSDHDNSVAPMILTHAITNGKTKINKMDNRQLPI